MTKIYISVFHYVVYFCSAVDIIELLFVLLVLSGFQWYATAMYHWVGKRIHILSTSSRVVFCFWYSSTCDFIIILQSVRVSIWWLFVTECTDRKIKRGVRDVIVVLYVFTLHRLLQLFLTPNMDIVRRLCVVAEYHFVKSTQRGCHVTTDVIRLNVPLLIVSVTLNAPVQITQTHSLGFQVITVTFFLSF